MLMYVVHSMKCVNKFEYYNENHSVMAKGHNYCGLSMRFLFLLPNQGWIQDF